jgi:CDP-glycerol glycerophosphotransferase (TagB/SpsB family)
MRFKVRDLKFFLLNKLLGSAIKFISMIIPKDKDMIVFGAFMGRGYGDNSAYLFDYCNNNKKGVYKYIWLSDDNEIVDSIRVVQNRTAYLKRSLRGFWVSLRANLFVTSHGIQDVLFYSAINGRTPELFLHHGIPIRGASGKALTNDVYKDNRLNSICKMIATSEWGGEQQQKNFPINSSKILVTGYPRNDIFFKDNSIYKQKIKKDIGIEGHTVLYAPTWRKWGKTEFFPFEDFDLKVLVSYLRDSKTTIVIHPHFVDLRRSNKEDLLRNVEWCKDVIKVITKKDCSDIQSLMLVSDILITDYSSIFYDFLLLDRPIFFFPYDLSDYSEKMGDFLTDYHNGTPGVKIYSQVDFIGHLAKVRISGSSYKAERQELCRKAHRFSDGKSSERIFNFLTSNI